jgi:excisionase family DNA binding protein
MKMSPEINRAGHGHVMQRAAWSLAEIAEQTGLSLGFLRNEVRAARLPVRKFGRRVLVLDDDLRAYLTRGSERQGQ